MKSEATEGGRTASRPDPLNPEQRRLNMSRIRGKDTKPELVLRKGLHGRGLRYRLHDRRLPGTPDLVFSARHAVVFVNGCFWHGHNCSLYKVPATNSQFWIQKIGRNQARDAAAKASLVLQGWRVLTVWECAMRGPGRRQEKGLLDMVEAWLAGSATETEIFGDEGNDTGSVTSPSSARG